MATILMLIYGSNWIPYHFLRQLKTTPKKVSKGLLWYLLQESKFYKLLTYFTVDIDWEIMVVMYIS